MRLFMRFGILHTFGIITICFYIWILLILKLLNYRDWLNWSNRLQNKYLQPANNDLHGPCNLHVTDRGFNQRIIAISMFGPKENVLFQSSSSLSFLRDLIQDVYQVYPGWILRVYHDNSFDTESIRELQCRYDYVDFYNMTGRPFTPPRMWRFLSIGDLLVDISKYSFNIRRRYEKPLFPELYSNWSHIQSASQINFLLFYLKH